MYGYQQNCLQLFSDSVQNNMKMLHLSVHPEWTYPYVVTIIIAIIIIILCCRLSHTVGICMFSQLLHVCLV